MGWTFKLHAAAAAALAAVLLAAGALTWLPGLQWPAGSTWPIAVVVALTFLIFLAAFVRMVAARRGLLGAFLWEVPVRVSAVLAALFVAGVLTVAVTMSQEEGLQDARARDGRYYAYDTAPYARATVEISADRYRDILEGDVRAMLAIPALLLLVAAAGVLAAGEVRRPVK